jgi:hypothetical protein
LCDSFYLFKAFYARCCYFGVQAAAYYRLLPASLANPKFDVDGPELSLKWLAYGQILRHPQRERANMFT